MKKREKRNRKIANKIRDLKVGMKEDGLPRHPVLLRVRYDRE
jgi:hypothetical protein